MVLLRTSTVVGYYRHLFTIIATPTVPWRPLTLGRRCAVVQPTHAAKKKSGTSPYIIRNYIFWWKNEVPQNYDHFKVFGPGREVWTSGRAPEAGVAQSPDSKSSCFRLLPCMLKGMM